MPIKICTLPPDMYSMNTYIGSNLCGVETQQTPKPSLYWASCELSASAADVSNAANRDVVTAEMTCPTVYPILHHRKEWKEKHYSVSFIRRFRIFVTAAVCSGCTSDTAGKPAKEEARKPPPSVPKG
jgi:hypothetical protein